MGRPDYESNDLAGAAFLARMSEAYDDDRPTLQEVLMDEHAPYASGPDEEEALDDAVDSGRYAPTTDRRTP